MDDKDRPPAPESAQEERDKGAAMEYDAADEDALAQSAPPPAEKNTPQREEK